MGALDGKALATLAYAHARAKRTAPALFGALGVALTRRVGDLDERGLASVCWAFATSRTRAPILFHALADEATRQMRFLEPQQLSNVAWAFAKAQATFESCWGSRKRIWRVASSARAWKRIGARVRDVAKAQQTLASPRSSKSPTRRVSATPSAPKSAGAVRFARAWA